MTTELIFAATAEVLQKLTQRVRVDPVDPQIRREWFVRARCAKCRALRSMNFEWRGSVVVSQDPLNPTLAMSNFNKQQVERAHFGVPRSPGVAILVCRECESRSLSLLAWNEKELSIVGGQEVSVATEHTPEAVAYYLDQAARCRAANALSAAAAMFRAALEQLLFEQGFMDGMLDKKLRDLDSKRADGSAPAWALKMEQSVLDGLKRIGNGSIHPNGGDIAVQQAISPAALEDVEAVFEELLSEVYEVPVARAARIARIEQTAAKVTPPRK